MEDRDLIDKIVYHSRIPAFLYRVKLHLGDLFFLESLEPDEYASIKVRKETLLQDYVVMKDYIRVF